MLLPELLPESTMPKIDPDVLIKVIDAGPAARLPVVADIEADRDAVYTEHLTAQRQEVMFCVKSRKQYRNDDLESVSTHFLRAAECGARLGLPVDDLKRLPEKRLRDIFESTGADQARSRRYIFHDKGGSLFFFGQAPFYHVAITASGPIAYNIFYASIGALATIVTLRGMHETHKKRTEYAAMIQDIRDEIALIKSAPAVMQP